MRVYQLTKDMVFPDPENATKDGIVAIGGDLSVDRLIMAYACGIFPWFSENDPILWWSPDPRFVLFPSKLHISKSMKKFMKKNLYQITFDTNFREVINFCRVLRTGNTWITDSMIEGYLALYNKGYAHSVEVWHKNRLVGGLYGVSLGSCFFGESMFSVMDNASKIALIMLTRKLQEKGFSLIDCQVYTEHLASLGAELINRTDFLKVLKKGLEKDSLIGSWTGFNPNNCFG